MFAKVLIANRGEIACRVMRTCQYLGIGTVAVYSDADSQAQHVLMADEAVRLGPAAASESYLRADKVLAAARHTGAEAIHPGYGFLSENAEFARACEQADIAFIGPPASAIDAMGSKSAAKRIMEAAGVPLVPGYHGDDQSESTLRQAAEEIGYPVMLKAIHGGGGKGMRVVTRSADLADAIESALREGQNAFGSGDLLIEKCVVQPRHLEIQVFTDTQGGALYLAERDCSVQRRHQKVLEEAPAPGVSESLRRAMGEAAVRAAQAIDYVGAGTVEFLLDADGAFYFMEMNTRLQVEHPVTEMITGLDLVAWQLQVAAGEPLPLSQNEVVIGGHAIEARIYAEDPDQDFLPATGTLSCLRPPRTNQAVRVDTGVVEGDAVSMYYDPMIAKLVVWGESRAQALSRLAAALGDYQVDGLVCNIPFLRRIVLHPAFAAADLDTGFIERHREDLFPTTTAVTAEHLAAAALIHLLLCQRISEQASDPWQALLGWRLNRPAAHRLDIEAADGELHTCVLESTRGASFHGDALAQGLCIDLPGDQSSVFDGAIQWISEGEVALTLAGHRRIVRYAQRPGRGARHLTLFVDGSSLHFTCQPADEHISGQSVTDHALTAPMNGTLVSILVEAGQSVRAGTPLVVMEAMKMEHSIRAPADGVVEALHYQTGDAVSAGVELLAFVPDEETVA